MRTWILLATLAGLFSAADGRTQAPPRDPAAAQAKGTGEIKGRVIDSGGKPLRRARITLDLIGGGSDARRTTSTGLDGAYSFTELPAGRFRMTATRGGYLELQYGQRRPGEQGRPLQLADGATLEKVDFTLPKMSTISGRITDENGEPIEGVSVYAMRMLYYEGRRKLVPVSGPSIRTDDDGEYRISRLAPGTYHVMASTNETWTVVQEGRQTVFGYSPTYFPGVTRAPEGRRVPLGLGEHVRAVDFSLVPGRAARISGTALDSAGKPFTRVSLATEVRGTNFASFGGGPAVRTNPDGTFYAINVPPGEYSLQASRTAGPDGPAEAAIMPLIVDGQDLENLVLTGSSGGTVTGRVLSEDGTLPKASTISLRVAEIYRNQAPPVLLGTFRDRASGPTVGEDGTFVVNNVFGRARFQVTLPDGWMLKSIKHEGREITDGVLELRSGEQVAGVEILISRRVTEASGQIVDGKGNPVGDATVILFPVEEERWFESSRAVRAARPDQQGRWRLMALPAGDYFAIAMDYVEVDAWQDPEYLAGLRDQASRITIPDGGAASANLTLVVPKQ
jgi:hypothetical protein